MSASARSCLTDKQLLDEFARGSVIAKEAPGAVDVADAALARIVVAVERERLFGQVRRIPPQTEARDSRVGGQPQP
jgi:hypothetical protein